MNALATVRYCQAAGITLKPNETGHLVATPGNKIDTALKALLTQHKAAILEYLQTGNTLALVPDDESLWVKYPTWQRRQILAQIELLKKQLAADTLEQETPNNAAAATSTEPRQGTLLRQPHY